MLTTAVRGFSSDLSCADAKPTSAINTQQLGKNDRFIGSNKALGRKLASKTGKFKIIK